MRTIRFIGAPAMDKTSIHDRLLEEPIALDVASTSLRYIRDPESVSRNEIRELREKSSELAERHPILLKL